MDIEDKIIQGIDDFPTLPTIYTQLSEIMSNPNAGANDAAKIISYDQAAVSKILRYSNSSIFSFKKTINSVSEAIFHLGFTEVKNLIFAMSVINLFEYNNNNSSFSIIDLWKHSIAVGIITRIIGNESQVRNIENYFITGILHNIGKMFLIQYVFNEFREAYKFAIKKNISLVEAENLIIGTNHYIIGDIVSKKWRIPMELRTAIKYYNVGLVDEEFDHLTASLHLANIVAHIMDLGNPGESFIPQPNEKIWEHLNLEKNIFTSLMQKINSDYQASLELFHL